MRDVPLRTKLLVAIISVASVGGVLTLLAGGFLLNAQVIQEANRRVELALKTARSALETRLAGTRTACSLLADELGAMNGGPELALPPEGLLEGLRDKAEFDYLHLIDARGIIRATARGNATGQADSSPLVQVALKEGRAVDGFRIVPSSFLASESQELAAKSHVQVIPTPRAKGDKQVDLSEAMVLEAASPVVVAPGRVIGVVRAGMVINRNSDMVDRIRNTVFTVSTYKGKNFGTVTIFQDDVRIATNVTGPDGSRAIGTRVSAEVYDQVLRDGRTWLGPAFVVGNWYVSAYEPIRDGQGRAVA
ncbi:MAG TPA: cache domain-containing protein, partial [Armatimonadota bacterium]|nr:cache domain-containing protein [Armatimonadota bacterium]